MDLEHIRKLNDREFAKDVLRARSAFLRLRRRDELAVRSIYVRAATQVGKELRRLKPEASKLTRNQLIALEKALRREAELIRDAVSRTLSTGMEEAVDLAGQPIGNHLIRAIEAAEVPMNLAAIQRGFGQVNRAAVEALWARTYKGLTLSDRIWRSATRARDRMRDVIQAGLASGRDAVQIARDLERYVRSGRSTLAKDYPQMAARLKGRVPKDLCYESLRLVRSEYTHAFAEGTYARGQATPSYLGIKWSLSPSHPIYDICDELAEADLYDLGPGVYPKGKEPVVPHPNCLCTQIPALMDTNEFVNDLIEWREDPESIPYIDDWYNGIRGAA